MLTNGYKTVEFEGKKYYEKSEKVAMKLSNYGRKVIKGSEIQGFANIPVNFDIENDKDYVMLSGYLNNKLIPNTDLPAQDSYGDIPTGKNVYNIDRLINNPVVLMNHDNDADGIAGNFIFLKEDKQGLQFREISRPLDEIYNDDLKDAVSSWNKGWGKAYSIGGRWLYDWDKSDPSNNTYILVKAILHEASKVGIGADQWALTVAPNTENVNGKGDITECKTLEESIEKYLETDDERYIDQIETYTKEKGEKKK